MISNVQKYTSFKLDLLGILYPGIYWNGTWSSVRDNDFIEHVHNTYLFQMVMKLTRRREGQQPNILDLVLVNGKNLV